MKLGGLGLILVAVAGAVFGMYAIAANLNMTAPVDTYGSTVSQATNLTQQNVSAVAQVAPTAGVFIALIVAVILLVVMVLYFGNAFKRAGRL